MRKLCAGLLAFAALACLASPGARAQTIDAIKARGRLVCPVPTASNFGFLELDDRGNWRGMDTDLCRAVATALLGTPDKVTFSPVSWADRFTALQSGTLDIVVMSTGWTRARDARLGLLFTQPYFFGGAQLLVPSSLGAKSAKDLRNVTICAVAGTTVERNVGLYLTSLNAPYRMLTFEKGPDATAAYRSGRCEALANFGPQIAALRALEFTAAEHAILPDAISMEPQAMALRQNDVALWRVANWTLMALVQADMLGVTKDNADAMRAQADARPEVKFLLGATPGIGDGLGLRDTWALDVIKAVGNYGELYARSLGDKSPYQLPPGPNQPWNKGGLLFTPTFD